MEPGTLVGGFSETRPATAEIQKITDQVRPLLEQKTNEKYEKFKAVEYKSQVVAGQIFLIKVDVGRGSYVHMKVFQGLSRDNDLELLGYQTNKTKNDELIDF